MKVLPNGDVVYSTRIPAEIYTKLVARKKKDDRSMASLIRMALKKFLK